MPIIEQQHFGIARKIVSNMTSESWETIPHACYVYEPEVTAFMKECKKLNEGKAKEDKITINTVMLRVVIEGLKAAPILNAHIKFNRKLVRGRIDVYDEINISMPMILPTGEMMTINLHNLENKSLTEITKQIQEASRRANNSDMNEVMFEVSLDNTLTGLKEGKILQTVRRLVGSKTGKHKVHTLSGEAKKKYYSIPVEDRLTKHDIEQGTITVSNIGSIYREQRGQCTLLEIVPPQLTAIAVGAAEKRAVVVTDDNGNDSIEAKMVMPLTLAFDHRAVDFGDVVPFMKKLDEIFAHPEVIREWV